MYQVFIYEVLKMYSFNTGKKTDQPKDEDVACVKLRVLYLV